MAEEFVEKTILRPIWGNYISLDLRLLQQAVREHKRMRVTILNMGTAIFSPRWWYDTAIKIEKRKVHYKTPMIFVYNFLPIKGALLKSKKNTPGQQGLFPYEK